MRSWERLFEVMDKTWMVLQEARRLPVEPVPASKWGWLQTHNGRRFYPMDPKPDAICIEDIAHALARICRFNGHVKDFYSVAQHSVLVSYEVPEHLALEGLLHDAQEAYLGDMIHPLKVSMPEYRAVEATVEKMIAEKFGLVSPIHPLVKKADHVLLATERRDLLAHSVTWTSGEEPRAETIRPLDWFDAEEQFMRRYRYLMIGRRCFGSGV